MFTHRIRSFGFLPLALVVAALTPTSLTARQGAQGAQGAPAHLGIEVAEATPLARAAPVGPRLGSTDIVRWTPPSPFSVAEPLQDRVHVGQNIAMMAVGGAGLVIGLVIGGDGGLIIATTGGVVGLIGLYRYLR
jgi:hypothetical protein